VITIVDYDSSWPERFETLRAEYSRALNAAGVPVLAIEHVGSTAVPGLAAKPIIDCDIVVDGADVAAASAVMISLGFTALGELGIPERWAFKEPERLARTNTYVVIDGCLSLRNHLALRDTLRANVALRDYYATVKKQVGASAADIDAYGQAKGPAVLNILAAAGLPESELVSIAGNQVPLHDVLPR
jgi:GrpB-like predicted nucleotidyltransferase (UPF0157 family)